MFRRTILLALAALSTTAPAAQAGTFTVHGCRTASGAPGAPVGDAQYGWHSSANHTTFRVKNGCSEDNGSAFLSAVGTAQYNAPTGSEARWWFTAPPATSIGAFRIWWTGSGYTSLPHSSSSAYLDWGSSAVVYDNQSWGTHSDVFSSENLVDITGIDRPSITARIACDHVDECIGTGNPSHEIAWMRIWRSQIELRDITPPAADAGGSLVADSGWQGTETLEVNASDQGGGVYRALIEVDGEIAQTKTLDTLDGRCVDANTQNANPHEFFHVRPCASQTSADVAVDTTRFADGARTIRVLVDDAAGNRALAAGPITRTVDNVPPPANTRAPGITGSPKSGSSLAGEEGAWAGDGLTYAFAWQRCEADGATCADIPGATGRSYTASDADAGKRLRLRVRATNAEGSTDAFSAPTAAVTAASNDSDATVSRGGGGTTTTTAQPATVREAPPLGTPNGEGATPLAVLTARESGTDRRVMRVRYGRSTVVTGRLSAPGGTPITGAKLDVVSQDRASGAPLVALGAVETDSAGQFRFVVGPGASRMVRFGYRARVGDVEYAQTTEVDVQVVAKVGFRLSRKKLRNGQTLRYLGKIHGPRTGHRFAEVQVRQGRKWIVVCSVRSDARGSFACANRFTRTFATTKYRFRARVRRQAGLPYEPAVSPTRSIVVRPRGR